MKNLKQQYIRQASEDFMNQHSLMQKKKLASDAGLPQEAVKEIKLEGVNPSQAQPSNGLSVNKAVAAAGLAQQMGVMPQEGPLGGVVSGATAGAAFGPAGAAVGAVAGGVMGAASAAAARKRRNAEIEAKKHMAIGQIRQQEGQNIANVLSNMGSRMKIT